jgi:hypothetical protein
VAVWERVPARGSSQRAIGVFQVRRYSEWVCIAAPRRRRAATVSPVWSPRKRRPKAGSNRSLSVLLPVQPHSAPQRKGYQEPESIW